MTQLVVRGGSGGLLYGGGGRGEGGGERAGERGEEGGPGSQFFSPESHPIR